MRRSRFHRTLLLLLSAVAGYVDVLAFTHFDRVFVANMTGNTVLLGVSLVQGDWSDVLECVFAIVGFMGGAAVGTWTNGVGTSGDAPEPSRRTLGVEAACLGVAALVWGLGGDTLGLRATLLVLTSAAMGLQSAAARQLDVLGITTTYITGTLTRLATLAVHQLAEAAPPVERSAPPPPAQAAVLGATWTVYLGGVVVTAGVLQVTTAWAMAVPVAVLAAVVVGWRRWCPPEDPPSVTSAP